MDDFKQAVIKGNFTKAKQLSINMNYLLLDKESSELHYLASFLLSMGLNHLQGAYQTAFFHAKKAVELSPQDNSYKEYLLFFYEDFIVSYKRRVI